MNLVDSAQDKECDNEPPGSIATEIRKPTRNSDIMNLEK